MVEGARAGTVVQDVAGLRASALLQAFEAGARRLQSEGAAAITTSCGFLVLFPGMDVQRARAEAVAAALRLQQRAPQLRTLVLECTNLPPHAAAIEAAVRRQRLWKMSPSAWTAA